MNRQDLDDILCQVIQEDRSDTHEGRVYGFVTKRLGCAHKQPHMQSSPHN